MQMNEHVHPAFHSALAVLSGDLLATLAEVRALDLPAKAAMRERTRLTAMRPPLPYWLTAKRTAIRALKDRAYLSMCPNEWAKQNAQEAHTREALRAYQGFKEFGALA